MPPTEISRRALLAASFAAAACGRRKATAFPGYCFVANNRGRSVAAVDLRRFLVRKQIPLDGAPAAVMAHPGRPSVFALAPETGTVYEIEAPVLEVSRRARAGNQAVAMQVSPAKDALWVLYRDPPSLVEFPFGDFRARRRIRLPAPADSFDLSVLGHAAIASRDAGRIFLASLAHSSVERTIVPPGEPSLIAYQWDGKQLIAGSRAERLLTIFDTATGGVVVRLPIAVEPRHFCFNSDGGQLFVSGDGMDAVVIVFPYTTEVDQTILAGHAPGVMTATTKGPAYLLVANPDTNGVTVLDVDTRKLVAVVEVGQHPGSMVLTPDEEYALVLNEKSNDLAVIRLLSLTTTPTGSTRRYKSAPLFTLIPVGEGPVSAAVVSLG